MPSQEIIIDATLYDGMNRSDDIVLVRCWVDGKKTTRFVFNPFGLWGVAGNPVQVDDRRRIQAVNFNKVVAA